MRYLSLFTGIGGFELGIQQAYVETITRKTNGGGKEDSQKDDEARKRLVSKKRQTARAKTGQSSEHPHEFEKLRQPACVGFSEIDRYATQIYSKHFPEHKNYGDITKIDATALPDFDFLCGGFPCQSFSIAGKRKGFDDTRGTLFFDIARILRAKQPRLFLLENVKGLLSHDNGNTFKTIIATLDELGYDLQWQVLNSKNFGVPQNRERVFIVGHLRGTSRPKVFPFGEGDRESKEISQLNHPRHSNDRIYDPEGLSPTLNTAQGGNRQPKIITSTITTENAHGFGKNVTANQVYDIAVLTGKIRRLTPKECERLQGFPDDWTAGGLSDIMEICVNINPAIKNRLLELATVSNITSDGNGMVIPISKSECKEPVNIVLEELLPEDIAINTINLGNATATLFNRKGTLLNATQLRESLTSEKTAGKSTCKLWKVRLLGHYEKEKLSTILTWINETMQSITSISARTDESIIGVITVYNSQELSYSNEKSLCLRMGNITSISDTQRYKTCGNAVTVNVIQAIMEKLL